MASAQTPQDNVPVARPRRASSSDVRFLTQVNGPTYRRRSASALMTDVCRWSTCEMQHLLRRQDDSSFSNSTGSVNSFGDDRDEQVNEDGDCNGGHHDYHDGVDNDDVDVDDDVVDDDGPRPDSIDISHVIASDTAAHAVAKTRTIIINTTTNAAINNDEPAQRRIHDTELQIPIRKADYHLENAANRRALMRKARSHGDLNVGPSSPSHRPVSRRRSSNRRSRNAQLMSSSDHNVTVGATRSRRKARNHSYISSRSVSHSSSRSISHSIGNTTAAETSSKRRRSRTRRDSIRVNTYVARRRHSADHSQHHAHQDQQPRERVRRRRSSSRTLHHNDDDDDDDNSDNLWQASSRDRALLNESLQSVLSTATAASRRKKKVDPLATRSYHGETEWGKERTRRYRRKSSRRQSTEPLSASSAHAVLQQRKPRRGRSIHDKPRRTRRSRSNIMDVAPVSPKRKPSTQAEPGWTPEVLCPPFLSPHKGNAPEWVPLRDGSSASKEPKAVRQANRRRSRHAAETTSRMSRSTSDDDLLTTKRKQLLSKLYHEDFASPNSDGYASSDTDTVPVNQCAVDDSSETFQKAASAESLMQQREYDAGRSRESHSGSFNGSFDSSFDSLSSSEIKPLKRKELRSALKKTSSFGDERHMYASSPSTNAQHRMDSDSSFGTIESLTSPTPSNATASTVSVSVSDKGSTTESRRKAMRRCVSFQNIEVIEHAVVLGDSKTSKDEYPITLDWEPQARTSCRLDSYEKNRESTRRGKAKRLPGHVRKDLLRRNGFSADDIHLHKYHSASYDHDACGYVQRDNDDATFLSPPSSRFETSKNKKNASFLDIPKMPMRRESPRTPRLAFLSKDATHSTSLMGQERWSASSASTPPPSQGKGLRNARLRQTTPPEQPRLPDPDVERRRRLLRKAHLQSTESTSSSQSSSQSSSPEVGKRIVSPTMNIGHPSLPAATATAPEPSRPKSVKFGDIEILELPLIVGDNPSVRDGCPITVDWECQNRTSCNLKLFEQFRLPSRKPKVERIPSSSRVQLLRKNGVSDQEMALACFEVTRAKRERQETLRVLQQSHAESLQASSDRWNATRIDGAYEEKMNDAPLDMPITTSSTPSSPSSHELLSMPADSSLPKAGRQRDLVEILNR